MQKEFLLNSITKEMKLIRRISTLVPQDQVDFRPKEGMRSTMELLHYLCRIGTGMISYWERTDGADPRTHFAELNVNVKEIILAQVPVEMDKQIALIEKLFSNFSEAELYTKEVTYPWGEKALLGQALIETSIKYLTSYKLQLFVNLKMSTDLKLGTPDLWRKTEIGEIGIRDKE
ncbi:MAG: hypothetical protein SGJ10_05805 [Bacteroidota bacterium]|nr:hypothetical protein [Bacteroidota bacterium]